MYFLNSCFDKPVNSVFISGINVYFFVIIMFIYVNKKDFKNNVEFLLQKYTKNPYQSSGKVLINFYQTCKIFSFSKFNFENAKIFFPKSFRLAPI